MTPALLLTILAFLQTGSDETGSPTDSSAAAADTDAETGTAGEASDEAAAGESESSAGDEGSADSETPVDESPDDGDSAINDTLSDIMHTGAMGYMTDGGLFMWPILLLGIIGAGVIIERYRSLKLLTADGDSIRSEVHDLLIADKVEDALTLCDRKEGPVPAILSAGLRKFYVLRRLNYDVDRIREQVVKAMDDYNIHIIAALEKHLPILATIASVAPMLGFLGTVAGMIVSFDNIDTNFGNENIVKLAAGGIKVSLLTTAFGLMIGIPAFMAFNYFTSVIDRFVLEVEESATDLIEAVTLQTALEDAAGSAASSEG